jgi:hypothetical protein
MGAVARVVGDTPETTRRPAYYPSMLLKLYAYDYLNQVLASGGLDNRSRAHYLVLPAFLRAIASASRRLGLVTPQWPVCDTRLVGVL